MGTTTPIRVAEKMGAAPQRRYPFPDPGLALEPPIVSCDPEDVAEVCPLPGHKLSVRFFDGTAGTVEMHEMISGKNAGVFKSLADPDEFANVGIGFGAVMWANELDLAPDVMYDEIKRNGVWVLR